MVRRGFNLVELLVVLSVAALLLGLFLPALARARVQARIVRAHADLRSITQALALYEQDTRGGLPPTRASCNLRSAYELPVELALGGYLPSGRNAAGLLTARFPDVFRPAESYGYRAPGPAFLNETVLLPRGSNLWVPDRFPDCSSEDGRYYSDPAESPVRYALWSIGPNADSPRFAGIFGRAPLPSRFWCRGPGAEGGVISHFQDRQGTVRTTP